MPEENASTQGTPPNCDTTITLKAQETDPMSNEWH